MNAIRAGQFTDLTRMKPLYVVLKRLLATGDEILRWHVREQALKEIRRRQAILDIAPFDHCVAHILDHTDTWLKAARSRTVKGRTIVEMLTWIVDDLVSVSGPEADTFDEGWLPAGWI